VRVIKYGPSIELCGGCHVSNTGRIGSIRIIMETSVAAGVRRIEAVTAAKADELFYRNVDMLNGLRSMFNNAPDIMATIQKQLDENSDLKKQVDDYRAEKVAQIADKLIEKAEDYKGIQLVKLTGDYDPTMLRNVLTALRGKFANQRVAIVGTTFSDDKPMISIFLSQPLVDEGKNAGTIIKSAAKLIQGGGGGQPWMATAGGRDVNGLNAAMEEMLAAL